MMVEVLLLPFIACLILTGIHAYFGIHVIEREVIFVDLALAQMAALGAIVAMLIGWHLHSLPAYFCSLGFTLVGSAMFSFTRVRQKVVPQEAIIGIVYAVSAVCSILVLDRAPAEAEHIKHMMVGNILFVRSGDIMKMAAIYSLVGLFHYFFRHRFIEISMDPQGAIKRNVRIKWWDFLFYATFGIVVTSSVEIAGVLLVFSYLIVPSVCAMLLATRLRYRLFWGWTLGTAASIIGLSASAAWDLPTGAAVVCTFGLMAISVAGRKAFR
ncbi:metal ABC transporter permease [candidate division TA06 bacterium]|uniref:Metal ABC transporter permease n=1 Tax=candidate division TA06 bacterium TaxID=2250710 RepID=A0A933MIP7_UNCT6|nr:metal ABC transporter permease [candidate division TA06 bacterium]